MSKKLNSRRISRRKFLKLGAGGVVAAAMGGGALAALTKPLQAAPQPPQAAQPVAAVQPPQKPNLATLPRRLVTTDGFISLPGRRVSQDNGILVFGFVEASMSATLAELIVAHKGKVKLPAPIIDVSEDEEVYITVTNVGFQNRPDLDDSHTIHWHGFRNPNAIFDGVPEVSLSVPVGRNFPYFFKTHLGDAGTYMYHCHFEDVEHVQMGMDGVIFVRPKISGPDHAYNDSGPGNPDTSFDREYTLLLNEIDPTPHDNLLAIQDFVWSDFKPSYWVINGRSFPDTILREGDPTGEDPTLETSQPVSSLIQAEAGAPGEPGEKILLRFAHLGYQQHAMQLLGIRMTVVGHDASFLGSQTYETNTIYIGPGEARDVIFEAPPYSGVPDGTDDAGPYDVYWLKNRNYQRLVNGNEPGLGGMVTQVRVYPQGALGTQTRPNETFPRPEKQ